jgi:ABC-type multidrug transport system fused ATPase/permease subunit
MGCKQPRYELQNYTMSTTIEIKNLHFNYNEKTAVFDGQGMKLDIQDTSSHMLYGIIGPSGTGKTTLISILGGQLNPDSGEILIDNTNIYKVDDLTRRTLIAMQLQTATSLRGKLRYNLLFGLPKNGEEQIYSDEELVDVLKRVGLWNLFVEKDGLETLIGEGGLNLSGGQRQRLNFASLYLRAKYFQPKLILIDEPTSSLDEISERAITKMIDDLASQAVTFVVAHRLKTLDSSVGILDVSMVKDKKYLEFMDKKMLLEKSQYYKDLIEGRAELED